MESNRDQINKGRDEIESKDEGIPILNLQALIIKVKEFVSKDNKVRYEKFAKDQDYTQYNTKLILKEFIGHKLYSFNVLTPKTYISFDEVGQLQIHSERKADTLTLNQYLCRAIRHKYPESNYSQIEDVDFIRPDIFPILKEAINGIKGLGELWFMALLLMDNDVFGRKLDNVLVEDDGTAKKIDTSEVNLQQLENFCERLEYLIKNNEFEIHDKMPFFNAIFKLLDEKQINAGVTAIARLMGKDFEAGMTWIGHVMGLDEKYLNGVTKVLQTRRMYILENFSIDRIEKSKKQLNSIVQEIILRPASDFQLTLERIIGGNSNPSISHKVDKNDKLNLLMMAHSIIGPLIIVLKDKLESLESVDKKTLLATAINQYSQLLIDIDDHIEKRSYKHKYLREVYTEFDQITKNYVDKALGRVDFEFIAAKITSFLSSKGKSNEDQIESLKKIFQDKYQGFFKQYPANVAVWLETESKKKKL